MKQFKKQAALVIALLLALLTLGGCSDYTSTAVLDTESEVIAFMTGDEDTSSDAESGSEIADVPADYETVETEPASEAPALLDEINEQPSAEVDAEFYDTEDLIDEYGSYTTKEDVALYLYTYGYLPENFITKKEAKALGWSGGSLEPYAPGKCIGGDYFGNYEGILPEDGSYHECDIDTLGASSRGAKRIVYSEDGNIYYTEDHYETFELLYGEE